MNHFFTLFAFALLSSVSAQTVLPPNYPYNPDSDGDEFVAVGDVLMSVASYDNEFQAQSIMVDTLSLEEAIQMLLQQQALNQQALIQSQQELIEGLTNSLEGVQGFEPCLLNWTCGVCPVLYQGYDYETVQIGEQCWFAENLRSENYRNGDAIPTGLSNDEWANSFAGAVVVYDEAASNLETYGRLYNWHAVADVRGVCPSGWHVPSDEEWMTLEMFLGMSEAEVNGTGVRGTNQGTQMKSENNWDDGGNGTNSSGFSGLPGGWRAENGNFYHSNRGLWWSSSASGSSAWYRWLTSIDDGVARWPDGPTNGFSVRCIKDSE